MIDRLNRIILFNIRKIWYTKFGCLTAQKFSGIPNLMCASTFLKVVLFTSWNYGIGESSCRVMCSECLK